MGPFNESLERVLARTHSALIVDIGAVSESRVNVSGVLTFAATPTETLFGETFASGQYDCRYDEASVVRSGDLVDYLVVSGSGREFDIKAGDRVILLIGAAGDAKGPCNVLRIEPLDQRDAIKQFGATRPRKSAK